ncbi:adenylate kinase [Natronogracilivirga saccharolytica]|uniref:Adenylate kinase n=1 Tax=Natronogracilivirga saccharolytica TaxID=2812953 RepID=A0A8J7S7F4_9BACT|nr:adenylate kinase [Natronogracilivirga saccharolytica]MBP3191603.1 adenylate kinase [Natronogracilivirga saccharolytica]
MRIIIFGPPGSGKGTQAKKIAAHFNISHLSTGNMFREAISQGTELGKLVESIIDQGHLVPDQTVVDLVEETIDKEEYNGGYIIDGFPRTVEQAVAFDNLLERRNESIDAFLSLHVPDEELVKRLLARGEGRSDDTEEKIRTRLDVYKKETAPVMDHYQQAGMFRSIDGTGTIDEIFERALSALPSK